MTDNRFERRYLREKQARQSAERFLEQKSLELYQRNTELESLKEHLEDEVETRTQEAREATDEAIRANTAKSQFLANMSHEIRTPLTAIIGFAELIRRDKPNEQETNKHLTTIINNGRHLTELLSEILDLSKIETQNVTLENRRFDLPKLLAELFELHKVQADSKSLTLNFDLSSGIPQTMLGDSTRIKQILHNLLSNAIKFTAQGRIDVSVVFDANTSRLTCSVADTGIGISPEQQGDVFDIFKQADNSINRKFGGTGLGLGIAKHLTNLMAGDLTLVSEPNQGSTFTAVIQCTEFEGEAHLLPSLTYEQHDSANSIPALLGSVLLVEDTEVNQQLITYHIQKTGAEVTLAVNGQKAIELAMCQEFDVILMDIQMPVLDGKEATKALKQLGYSRPIYALTANVMQSDIAEYEQVGFVGTLTKPLELNDLYVVLKQHLKDSEKAATNSHAEQIVEGRITELKPMFFRSLTEQLHTLVQAQEDEDEIQTSQILHVVKGSAGSFGYDELGELAAQALTLTRKNKYHSAVTVIESVMSEMKNIIRNEE